MNGKQVRELAKELEVQIASRCGVVLRGEMLWRELGFRSRSTFQRAVRNHEVGLPLFPVPGRRGWYALARDVAAYLAKLRCEAIENRTAEEAPDMT